MLQKMVEKKHDEGFTLVELLIVVAIIAILAAIAIPQFSAYRARAWRGELSADAKNIYTASQAYLSDFPTATIGDLTALTDSGYRASTNVSYVSVDMSLSSGNIKLTSGPLVAAAAGNETAVIDFNGAITYE